MLQTQELKFMMLKNLLEQLETYPISQNLLERWLILFLTYFEQQSISLNFLIDLFVVVTFREELQFFVKTNATYFKSKDTLREISYDKLEYHFCKYGEEEIILYFINFMGSVKGINVLNGYHFKNFRISIQENTLLFAINNSNGAVEMTLLDKRGNCLEVFNFGSSTEAIAFCKRLQNQKFETPELFW